VSNWATRTFFGTALAIACVLTACSNSGSSVRAAVKPDKDRKKAPDFTLKDSNGTAVKLSDYRGKVVLLNFWATWCGPCKIEIPWFMDFEQRFKDNGFSVLGVSMDDDGWEAVKPYLENRKVNYRIVMGDETVGNLYGGIESLPTTFLIDREGRVAQTHIGLVSKKDYEMEIAHLLATKAAAAAAPISGQLFARAR
jgi:peroxiredoxin